MKSAIIVAGGSSTRFGKNKLFIPIYGKPLIVHTVEKFVGIADEIILVASAQDIDKMRELFGDLVRYTVGGETRTNSVINGLMCLDDNSTVVAIHDGARPYVSKGLIQRAFARAEEAKSAVPALRATDSVVYDGAPLKRESVLLVQTPQTFQTEKLKQAYAKFPQSESDDSAVWQKAYGEPNFIEGDRANIKITYKSDVTQTIIGYGYDIHRLVGGRRLLLGGIEVPYKKGLLGHSDADVVLHSIMDAMLTAVGEKDIGHLFPNNDPQYKDISSLILLAKTKSVFDMKNATLLGVSCAIVCEKPRLAPYIDRMKETIAAALQISETSVNISVTTAESVGEIGRGRAIACRSTILGEQK